MTILRIIFFIFIWIFVSNPSTIKADEGESNSPYLDMLPARDPFAPRIPQQKIEAQPVKEPPVKQPPIPKAVEDIAAPKPEGPEIPSIDVSKLSFTVAGVIWNSNRPQAIINNQVVDQGDTLPNGARVLTIEKSEIKFLYEGYEVVIPL